MAICFGIQFAIYSYVFKWEEGEAVKRATVVIKTKSGLHARPASMLVGIAKDFKADITLINNEKTANCKSLLSILALAAKHGDVVELVVEGVDDAAAEKAILELFENKLIHEE